MKKLIILIISSFIISEAIAQERMSFHGIEMGCAPQAFVEKLVENGFTNLGTNKYGCLHFQGTHEGLDSCDIYLGSEGKVVDVVDVYSPRYFTWNELYSQWNKWRNILAQKYGKPQFATQKWEYGYKPQTEREKLIWFEEGNGKFEALYDVKGVGSIRCAIRRYEGENHVILIYVDNKAYTQNNEE